MAVAVMLGGTALAQDTDSYFVTYYSGNVTAAPDGTLRIVNDGFTETDIYANIFVFDDSEELSAVLLLRYHSRTVCSRNP